MGYLHAYLAIIYLIKVIIHLPNHELAPIILTHLRFTLFSDLPFTIVPDLPYSLKYHTKYMIYHIL